MNALELARWQFGITTIYHFVLVPLTIGLTPLVAIMQTVWYRTCLLYTSPSPRD